MQDNTNHNTEDAFLEESWVKMRALLEEDLPAGSPIPVKKKRSSEALALLGLLLLIGTGFWLWQKTSMETDVTDSKPSAALDKQAIVAGLSDAKTKPDVITYQTASGEELSSIEIVTEKNIGTKAKEKKLAIIEASDKMSTQKEPISGAMVSSITKENSETITQAIVLPTQALNNITNLEEIETNPIGAEEKITSADQLLLRTELHPALEKKEVHSNKMFPSPTPHKKWQFGLIAGVQLEKLHDGFGGFNGGVLLARRMGKRFSLETGLSYTLNQFNNTKINSSPTQLLFNQNEEDNYPGVPGYVTGTPFTRSESENLEPLELGKASWLSIPILLSYQPARRIRVNMGVEIAHLLGANETAIFNNENFSKKDIKHYIQKNNIAALFGVAWYPQQNLGLDFRYNFGFTDLTKAVPHYIEQTDTRSSLQCSLIYYFGPSS